MKQALFALLALVLVFAVSCPAEDQHGHLYEPKTEEATCTEPGRTYLLCSCGKIRDEFEIPAKGHNKELEPVVKEPTEKEAGYYGKVCPDCKEMVEKEDIPKLLPGEIFVPRDTELKELTDEMILFLANSCNAYSNECTYTSIEEEYTNKLKDAVFKENVVIGGEYYEGELVPGSGITVKEGKVSFVLEQNNNDLTLTMSGSITRTVKKDDTTVDAVMTLDNATITAEWNQAQFGYINEELEDSGSLMVTDVSGNVMEIPGDALKLCIEIATGIYEELFSSFSWDSVSKTIAEKEDAIVYILYSSDQMDEESLSSKMIHNGLYVHNIKDDGIESHNIAYYVDRKDGTAESIKYVKYDGEFYDPKPLLELLKKNNGA